MKQPSERRLGGAFISILLPPYKHMIYVKELDVGTGLQLEMLVFGFESNLKALIVLEVPESNHCAFPLRHSFFLNSLPLACY